MTRSAILLAFLLLYALTAPGTLAQDGTVEAGVDLGFLEFDDSLGGETEAVGSLRLGYFFTDRFALEVQALRATSILDLELTTYLANAVFYFGESGKPYVSVGAGTAELEFINLFADNVDDSGTAFKGALGIRGGDPTGHGYRFELMAIAVDAFDETSTNLGFTGGYSYRFGS